RHFVDPPAVGIAGLHPDALQPIVWAKGVARLIDEALERELAHLAGLHIACGLAEVAVVGVERNVHALPGIGVVAAHEDVAAADAESGLLELLDKLFLIVILRLAAKWHRQTEASRDAGGRRDGDRDREKSR